ncbi:MAG: hypothetical protein WBA20_02450 [Ketobacter sp.]
MFSIFGFITALVMTIGTIAAARLKLKNANRIMAIGIRVTAILGAIFIPAFLLSVLNIDLYVANKAGIYFINMLVISLLILGLKRLPKGRKDQNKVVETSVS